MSSDGRIGGRSSRYLRDVRALELFEQAGLTPRIVQVADEKQTIISFVATKPGVAIVPRWTTRMAVSGVRFVPLRPKQNGPVGRMPLAWLRGSRDPARDAMLAVLEGRLRSYARDA